MSGLCQGHVRVSGSCQGHVRVIKGSCQLGNVSIIFQFTRRLETEGFSVLFNEDSIYNIKAVHKKVNEMGEKLKNLNDNVDNLETKIRMIEVESHQTKILIKNVPLLDEKDGRENYNATRNTVEDLLSFSNFELDSVSEFYRLYPKKESHSNPSKKNRS